MKNVILYAKSSILTAKALSKALGIKATRYHKNLNPRDTRVVIRYGHRFGMFADDTSINSPNAIEICGDSIKFQSFCKDAGFYCPDYISPPEYNKELFPVFLRNRFHFGGKDIKVVNNTDEYDEYVKPNSYVVVPAKIRYEIRIHVINQAVVKIFKKVGKDTDDAVYPIRTAHNGWKYSLVNEPYGERYKKARDISVELTKSLGLYFGAIDLGFDEDKREYIVFEVNTAPGLVNNSNTFGMYVQYFRSLLDV